MGLLGGVRNKLGFGDEPEWQDDYYDEEADDGYYDDEEYDDEEEGIVSVPRASRTSSHGVTFDDYNPNTFEHVRVSTDRELEVASYGSTRDSYFAQRAAGASGYAAGIGTSASRRNGNVRSFNDRPRSSDNWGPSDPSFLDEGTAASISRDARAMVEAAMSGSSDPYSQFDSDVKRISRDPSARIEIVRPRAYADVEKIASAFKAGKSVVLSLRETKPDLAKRILDFSFGVASALNGTVDKAADKVFVITKGDALTASEKEYLHKQGVL